MTTFICRVDYPHWPHDLYGWWRNYRNLRWALAIAWSRFQERINGPRIWIAS